MFSVGLISWWYSDGWKGRFARALSRCSKTLQFFSIGQLLRTLFSPYRQISASVDNSNLAVAIRGFFDKLFSRIIGSIVRTFTILAGLVAILLQAFIEFTLILVWIVLPTLPIVGALLFAMGWVPAW